MATQMLLALGAQLRGGCTVFNSDQQVKVRRASTFPHDYVYPDALLTCDPSFEGNQLLNPLLLVEVLSESSLQRDMDEKIDAYFSIASVQEYWVFSQEAARVVQYQRVEAGKTMHVATAGRHPSLLPLTDAVRATGLEVPIALEAIYAWVLRARATGTADTKNA